MHYSAQIAQHLHAVFFGGNWTSVNLKDTLADVSWQQATTQVQSCNTIAALVYHIGYYVSAITDVLQGRPLTAKDKFSFDHPILQSDTDWENMRQSFFHNAETLEALVKQLPDTTLEASFADEKYGSYYRNLHGLIEHTHYHLGQIVIIKKLLKAQAESYD